MRWFKRYIANRLTPGNAQINVLFQRWENMKRKVACTLQQRFELLPLKSRKLLLLLLLVLFMAANIALTIQALRSDNETIKVKQLPNLSHRKPGITNLSDSIITKAQYDRIELFKAQLLELRDDVNSKQKFDSIIQQRPRLLDSINAFEKMYLSQ